MIELILRPGDKNFLSRGEAARMLSSWGLITAAGTLATKACRGGGPPYHLYNGRAIYEATALRTWALTTVSVAASSTTEHAALRKVRNTANISVEAAEADRE
jgi:hypothetical protein